MDRSAISNVLANDPDYQVARELGLEAKLAAREAEVEAATDPRHVPRARELLSHARWRAERECPARWGQRSIVAVEHSSPDAAQILGAAADLVRALERRRVSVIPVGIVAASAGAEPSADLADQSRVVADVASSE